MAVIVVLCEHPQYDEETKEVSFWAYKKQEGGIDTFLFTAIKENADFILRKFKKGDTVIFEFHIEPYNYQRGSKTVYRDKIFVDKIIDTVPKIGG